MIVHIDIMPHPNFTWIARVSGEDGVWGSGPTPDKALTSLKAVAMHALAEDIIHERKPAPMSIAFVVHFPVPDQGQAQPAAAAPTPAAADSNKAPSKE